MPQRALLIPINIGRDADEYQKYFSMSAKEKIDLISDHVMQVCQSLLDRKIGNESTMWIVAWHEHGIFGKDTKYVNPDDINYLRIKMQQLVDKFPQLKILAGTLAVQKTKEKDLHLNKIQELYNQHEDKFDETNFHQYEDHKQHISKYSNNKTINVISNNLYIFGSDKTSDSKPSYQQHTSKKYRKISPYQETTDHKVMQKLRINARQARQNAIFQPGKDSPFSTMSVNNNKITITHEICADHKIGLSKKFQTTEDPLIHFILSDTTMVELDKINGKYFLLVDSQNKPQLMRLDDAESDEVVMIESDLFRKGYLSAPMKAITPNEAIILQEISKIRKKSVDFDGFFADITKQILSEFDKNRNNIELISRIFTITSKVLANYSSQPFVYQSLVIATQELMSNTYNQLTRRPDYELNPQTSVVNQDGCRYQTEPNPETKNCYINLICSSLNKYNQNEIQEMKKLFSTYQEIPWNLVVQLEQIKMGNQFAIKQLDLSLSSVIESKLMITALLNLYKSSNDFSIEELIKDTIAKQLATGANRIALIGEIKSILNTFEDNHLNKYQSIIHALDEINFAPTYTSTFRNNTSG